MKTVGGFLAEPVRRVGFVAATYAVENICGGVREMMAQHKRNIEQLHRYVSG